MPRISFRHAKSNELSRVIFVTKRAYQIPFRENTLITKAHEPSDIQESFAKKDFFVIAAILSNKIVGAVRYKFLGKNSLYLYKLAVLKTYREVGIGTQLVRKVEKAAKRWRCRTILLDCAREKELPGYYKELGFKIDKVKKHLDHHDVYMSKRVE